MISLRSPACPASVFTIAVVIGGETPQTQELTYKDFR